MSHGGQWRQAQDEYGVFSRGLVDLSASISPYGPGPKARAEWPFLVNRLDRYPDSDYRELYETVAVHYRIQAASVVLTAGATAAIDLVLQVINPRVVYVVEPAFSEYRLRATLWNIPVRRITETTGMTDPGLLFLANPVNPTGTLWHPSDLQEWITEALRHDVVPVIDEAFLEFVPDWRQRTLMQPDMHEVPYLILGSVTKFYGLAGLRVGFLVADPRRAKALKNMQEPWSIAWPSARVAALALQDQTYFDAARDWIIAERTWLLGQLARRADIVGRPAANFILVNPWVDDFDAWLRGLAESGVLVRDARDFQAIRQPAARIAVKTRRDSQRLLAVWPVPPTNWR